MKSLIVLHSYHHNNTQKVAEVISRIINAEIKPATEITETYLHDFNLIGFGAGIDSGKHYKELLEFVKTVSPVENKPCFIFSTSAVQGERKVYKDHTTVRNLLLEKGYNVLGEFSCKGFNTNVFLKYFGGMNRNRPNSDDLRNAEEFAKTTLQN